MKNTFTVHHNEHVSSRPFEEVVNAFESAVGSVEDAGLPALLASSKNAEEFESRVKSREGTSGFMRFLTVDHGAWLARIGLNAKARMYTIGNPLIAQTMLKHDIAIRTTRALRGVWPRCSLLIPHLRDGYARHSRLASPHELLLRSPSYL